MPSLISHLSQTERRELFDNIYYLNMQELKRFCNAHKIPYSIYITLPNEKIKKTTDIDRKGIIIQRIETFLKTGKIKPATLFAKSVVKMEKFPQQIAENDKIYYGQYKNNNAKILRLLKKLTAGKFAFGAIAQETLRDCWTKGKAPTYKEFAKLWLMAAKAHTQPNREWAFLADRSKGTAGSNWKKLRLNKASAALTCLNHLNIHH